MLSFLVLLLNPYISVLPAITIILYFVLFGSNNQKAPKMAAMTLLEQVTKHHKQAFECISEALKIDEDKNGDKDTAVVWYVQGVSELELGIAVPTMGASAEDKEKIVKYQTKMRKHLEMCRDRISILSKPQQPPSRNKSAPPKPKSGGESKPKPRPIKKPWNHGATGSQGSKTPPPTSKFPLARPPTVRSNSYKDLNGETSKQNPPNKRGKNLKSVPKEMANKIMDTAVEPGTHSLHLSDVVGQEEAKEALQDTVIRPAIRPDLYSGLRSPAKGLLLFGPPGNGKTFLAKAVASEAKSVFFNISAATLTSKWVGEGEKMVKALFAVAREVQPSIIFIDEIDSLLRTRQESDNDAQRRLQTEFLLQFDGVGTDQDERILVMGATNRPHELDDAALRRFPKRIYVRLPDASTRAELLQKLLDKHNSPLSKRELDYLAGLCENYSFSDLTALAKDASLGPVREIPSHLFETIDAKKMRKIRVDDFKQSLKRIRPSVSHDLLRTFERWNSEHGQTT